MEPTELVAPWLNHGVLVAPWLNTQHQLVSIISDKVLLPPNKNLITVEHSSFMVAVLSYNICGVTVYPFIPWGSGHA